MREIDCRAWEQFMNTLGMTVFEPEAIQATSCWKKAAHVSTQS